jgi:hypothetical protein
MLFLRVALSALVAASAIFAQDFTIEPNLRIGDVFQVEVTRNRTDSSRPQTNTSTKTVNTGKILAQDADGILLEWGAGQTQYADPAQQANPIVAAANAALVNLRVLADLSPDGEYEGVRNEAELSKQLLEMADRVLTSVLKQMPEGTDRTAVEAIVKQALTPATLIASATRDIQLYFGLHGVELAPGEAVEAATEQPSPLGGGTISTTFRVSLDSVNPDAATLSTATTYDEGQLLKRLLQQAGTPISEEDLKSMPALDVSDSGHYTFDRSSGLMRDVRVVRIIASGAQTRRDDWRFKLVKPPVR